ncbi:MAG: 2,3-bisphosphoglycerate-independent phosphoglycerate mutase [Acidobacteriota bacterium]
MDPRLELLQRQARQNDQKIVLLVLDGVGDIRSSDQPRTPLEAASTPHLDELASRSALGRLLPVAPGITPGSGPGHLGLFGYDPRRPETDIGRGVLEALGLGLDLDAGTVAARANFATVDVDGNLTDRRAGRIPTEECVRLCEKLRSALESWDGQGVVAEIHPGEGYRFVLLLRSETEALSAELRDTDPQILGVPPLDIETRDASAEATASHLRRLVTHLSSALHGEEAANSFLLRGFSQRPDIPGFDDLYGLRAGAFAGYPLYRGVASVCGMEVVPCGKTFGDIVGTVAEQWNDFDFFFLHVKQTDQAGEDGNFIAKVDVLESVDRELPRLLALEPAALAVTGDHSTPVPMKAHSWHPIPLLLHGEHCFVDEETRFDELAAARGAVGTGPSYDLMALLLANAGRLAKYGA